MLGMTRLVLELAKGSLQTGTLTYWMASINFLHFAALLFLLCSTILVVVSLVTPPPAPERVADLTLQTAETNGDADEATKTRGITVVMSVVLAATIGVLWFIFR